MPGVVHLGDVCSGHGGYGPRPSVGASTNVIADGIGVVRVGDPWAVHCRKSCHAGTSASGSSKVFANGLPVCRIGDAISCGSTMAHGSSKVIIG